MRPGRLSYSSGTRSRHRRDGRSRAVCRSQATIRYVFQRSRRDRVRTGPRPGDADARGDAVRRGGLAQLEATYLTPDIVEQRRLQLAVLALKRGENVLDIGSGPGLLAVQAAATVGASGSVHGIDSERPDAGDRRAPERAGGGLGSGAVRRGRCVRAAVRR